jgi:hypothetical protein
VDHSCSQRCRFALSDRRRHMARGCTCAQCRKCAQSCRAQAHPILSSGPPSRRTRSATPRRASTAAMSRYRFELSACSPAPLSIVDPTGIKVTVLALSSGRSLSGRGGSFSPGPVPTGRRSPGAACNRQLSGTMGSISQAERKLEAAAARRGRHYASGRLGRSGWRWRGLQRRVQLGFRVSDGQQGACRETTVLVVGRVQFQEPQWQCARAARAQ